MYKIFLTVRNRLSTTIKCITSIQKHSELPYQLYVYDNLTTDKIDEHFMFWSTLYKKGILTQVTFNTYDSTFNVFSKVVANNQFGQLHEMDPNKDNYDFLLFLDNDMILFPGWDTTIKQAWQDVKRLNMNYVKIIVQMPGGVQNKKLVNSKIAGVDAYTGWAGGSGYWAVKPDFFRDIGFLPVENFVGASKKHDQFYWLKLEQKSKGTNYMLGLDKRMIIHTGFDSICNTLTRNKNLSREELEKVIKFEETENYINSMTFDEFFNKIKDDSMYLNNW